MLDATARRVLDRPLSALVRLVDRPLVSPNRLTLLGLATGLASAATAAGRLWWWALGLWLFSRAMDGLDPWHARAPQQLSACFVGQRLEAARVRGTSVVHEYVEVQRLKKLLEDAGIKLSSVATAGRCSKPGRRRTRPAGVGPSGPEAVARPRRTSWSKR